MDLIQEQKHIPVFGYFGNHLLDALLKFTAVFGSGYHAGQIQRHHAFICNGFRHIAACDHLGKALHNRGFTYPRFTDQAGIIFRSSAQDLDNTLDLTFPADHRIQSSLPGKLCQITAEAV